MDSLTPLELRLNPRVQSLTGIHRLNECNYF